MKRILNPLLAVMMMISLCGCSSAEPAEEPAKDETASETVPEETEETVIEEETVDDPAWDELESLGKIETENGLFFVSITLPADFVGEEVTQESIDANAGTNYTSGKLNEDGSVTYRMTKAQHRAMLDSISQSIEDSLKEMTESDDYAFKEITHNDDFTSFDVTLTTEELGITESFMVIAFYMYGGMYSIFTGKQKDITVNYYSSNGDLLNTGSSADLAG